MATTVIPLTDLRQASSLDALLRAAAQAPASDGPVQDTRGRRWMVDAVN